MSKLKDLTKREFGRLVVIERAENTKNRAAKWKCRCKCGNITTVCGSHLRSGHTMSCGCLIAETRKKFQTTHGMSKTPEYDTWSHIIQRCNNPKNAGYKDYGGRGITICDKWLKFDGFFEDMGFKPKGLTIERRNNNLGYFKENCCWATYTEQARNKRIPKRNKTGVLGVHRSKMNKRYTVQIKNGNNKTLHIGQFTNLEEAAEARKTAEQKYWKAT